MQATLICHANDLLEELGALVAEQRSTSVRTLLRAPGEPLPQLLAQATGDVLVVDGADGEALADFDQLAGLAHAQPAPEVIYLSAQRDADTLLAAMRAGIREVLPPQPAAAEFRAALQRVAQRRQNGPRARVIAFVACKGGSGATFLATNLAWVLATECRRRTLLLDLDLQYGDAACFVTNGVAQTDLAEVARQVERLDGGLLDASVMHVAPDCNLLPAPTDPQGGLDVTGEQVARVLEVARERYDFILLDVERLLDPPAARALEEAETVHLVVQNLIPHVRDARRLVRTLRSLGHDEGTLRLVVNRFDRRAGLALPQVEEAVGLKVARTIADGGADVAHAVNGGVPIAQLHPHSPVTHALREMAAQLCDKAPPRGWLARFAREAA